MINKIIDGISVAINSSFGDEFEIYTESIEQGLKEPCFSILCINPSQEQVLGKRYFKTNQFCIHYFPNKKEKDKRSDCYSVLEQLTDILELIDIDGDLCRGTKMQGEVLDDVLHFFVNFDMFVFKEKEAYPVMEDITHNTDLKG